ncbi:hypothetical protein TALC_00261 [Thermoplasmatales archaeon BRNA1]|nr:hypothetical protein TALC_00261 [Thermoplasmatales archaeon BRNA1]
MPVRSFGGILAHLVEDYSKRFIGPSLRPENEHAVHVQETVLKIPNPLRRDGYVDRWVVVRMPTLIADVNGDIVAIAKISASKRNKGVACVHASIHVEVDLFGHPLDCRALIEMKISFRPEINFIELFCQKFNLFFINAPKCKRPPAMACRNPSGNLIFEGVAPEIL